MRGGSLGGRVSGDGGIPLAAQFLEVSRLRATHSPLVLAPVEPGFDLTKDALWKFDLIDGAVQIDRDAWHKRGDSQMWLQSDVFDETSGYSVQAEGAMAHASVFVGSDVPTAPDANGRHRDTEVTQPQQDLILR